MEAPSSLGQSSRWFVMFCRPNSYLMGSCSFTACSQPSHPFSSPYLQALPCLVSSRKVLAPTGANFPRVASLHERVVLISFVVLPRVRPVPREAIIQKHRRAPGSRCHHSSKVCIIPCKSLRDGSSGGVLLQGRPVPAHLGSGPRFQCPGFLRLNGTRAETDWEGPPCVPHSLSALWTCHTYSIRAS